MDNYNRPPNFFWPVILVGAGVILLLANLGIVEVEMLDFINLIQLWPLLLVAIGINLLFGSKVSWLGSLLSLLLGLAVVAFFLFAPNYITPLASADMVTESFTEELDGAESARQGLSRTESPCWSSACLLAYLSDRAEEYRAREVGRENRHGPLRPCFFLPATGQTGPG